MSAIIGFISRRRRQRKLAQEKYNQGIIKPSPQEVTQYSEQASIVEAIRRHQRKHPIIWFIIMILSSILALLFMSWMIVEK